MKYRNIIPTEFNDWVNLCAGGFEMPPDEFYDHYINDPEADCQGVFVAFDDTCAGDEADCTTGCTAALAGAVPEDGRMVSSVRVFRRRMYLRGEEVKCGAIGEVCTLREYRGRGISGRLLGMAVDYMVREDFAVSQLFTGVNDHYVRHGWFTVPMSYVSAEVKRGMVGDITLRPVEVRDVPTLCALHERYARRYDGVFSRKGWDEKYWLDWMVRNPGHRLAACSGDGSVIAYLDFVPSGSDGLTFREYLGAKELAAPLFGHAAAVFSNAPGSSVTLGSIPAPIASALGLVPLTHTERRDCMYRLNSPFSLSNLTVDSPSKLRSLLSDAVTFEADNY